MHRAGFRSTATPPRPGHADLAAGHLPAVAQEPGPQGAHSFIHSLIRSPKGRTLSPEGADSVAGTQSDPRPASVSVTGGPECPLGKLAWGWGCTGSSPFPGEIITTQPPAGPFAAWGKALTPPSCPGSAGEPWTTPHPPCRPGWGAGSQLPLKRRCPTAEAGALRWAKLGGSQNGEPQPRGGQYVTHTPQTHPDSWASLRGRWDCASVHWAGKSAMW